MLFVESVSKLVMLYVELVSKLVMLYVELVNQVSDALRGIGDRVSEPFIV